MSGYLTDTKAEIYGRESELLGALGTKWPDGRRTHILCPLPSHDDHSPSWRWDERAQRYHCTCGGGDVLDLIMQMKGFVDLLQAADWARQVLGLPGRDGKRETPAERQAREARIAEARRQAEERQRQREREDAEENAQRIEWIRETLWGMAYPPHGTVVETYLRSQARAITVVPDVLGYVPSYGPDKLPAMLMPFGIASEPEPGVYEIEADAVVGAHVTLLTPDGQKAVDREGRTKIILGKGHDAPLMLAPPNDIMGLCIAEGIEDALSAHQESGLGAWAAGTAGRLPGLAHYVPDYIEAVTIIEDDNPAGQAGCKGLATTLHKRGIEVLMERGRRADAAA